MAGRKHHFIQQHLSRGFAIDPTRRPSQVWVYNKNKSPYISATEGYGAERDFYGNPDDTEVDDAITKAENQRFDGFIQNIRLVDNSAEIDPREAARFYQHLLFRSKNIREVFAFATWHMMDAMRALKDQKGQVQGFLVEFFTERPEIFLPKIETQFGCSFTPEQRTVAIEFLRSKMPALVPQMMNELWPKIGMIMDSVIAQVPDLVAVGHKNALRKNFSDENGKREEEMRQLVWRVFDMPENVVLGDSCAFAELVTGRFMPMADLTVEIANLYLPVSSTKYMVGNKTGDRPTLSCDALNVAAIACSYERFCASAETEKYKKWAENIGRQVMPLSTEELHKIGRDCVGLRLSEILVKEFG